MLTDVCVAAAEGSEDAGCLNEEAIPTTRAGRPVGRSSLPPLPSPFKATPSTPAPGRVRFAGLAIHTDVKRARPVTAGRPEICLEFLDLSPNLHPELERKRNTTTNQNNPSRKPLRTLRIGPWAPIR